MFSSTDKAVGVLVDRDGTLIREVGYLNRLEQLELLPQVAEAIRLLCRHGLKVAVVTNQSAVGRGLLSEKELARIHQELKARLAVSGASIAGIYYCPHHPTEALGSYRVACDCRKPDIGLARQAAAELNLDLKRSYVVGDQATDMELANRIGARGVFIQDRRPETEDGKVFSAAGLRSPVVVVKDLWEAASWIVQDRPGQR